MSTLSLVFISNPVHELVYGNRKVNDGFLQFLNRRTQVTVSFLEFIQSIIDHIRILVSFLPCLLTLICYYQIDDYGSDYGSWIACLYNVSNLFFHILVPIHDNYVVYTDVCTCSVRASLDANSCDICNALGFSIEEERKSY